MPTTSLGRESPAGAGAGASTATSATAVASVVFFFFVCADTAKVTTLHDNSSKYFIFILKIVTGTNINIARFRQCDIYVAKVNNLLTLKSQQGMLTCRMQ